MPPRRKAQRCRVTCRAGPDPTSLRPCARPRPGRPSRPRTRRGGGRLHWDAIAELTESHFTSADTHSGSPPASRKGCGHEPPPTRARSGPSAAFLGLFSRRPSRDNGSPEWARRLQPRKQCRRPVRGSGRREEGRPETRKPQHLPWRLPGVRSQPNPPARSLPRSGDAAAAPRPAPATPAPGPAGDSAIGRFWVLKSRVAIGRGHVHLDWRT